MNTTLNELLPPGESALVLGETGSGKTTIAKALATRNLGVETPIVIDEAQSLSEEFRRAVMALMTTPRRSPDGSVHASPVPVILAGQSAADGGLGLTEEMRRGFNQFCLGAVAQTRLNSLDLDPTLKQSLQLQLDRVKRVSRYYALVLRPDGSMPQVVNLNLKRGQALESDPKS